MPKTKEEKNAYMKEWAKNNPDKVKKNKKKSYQNNKIKDNERSKGWRNKNKGYKAVKDKEYQEKNKEKISLKNKGYYLTNKVKIIKRNSEYSKKKLKEDPLFKLRANLRCRIKICLKDSKLKKTKSTELILGASITTVKLHIENQFKEGMTWSNHGTHGWHIDHIIPLSSAKTTEEIYNLCHYTNLQPLWAKDNLSKSNKIILKNCLIN